MPHRRPKRAGRARRLAVLVVLATVALAGCHTMRFEIVDAPHSKIVHHRKSFYVAGLFPRLNRVDVSQYCPHGVSRVREQTTDDDAIIGVATLGIWTPRSSWYYCLPGPGEGKGWVVDVPIPSPSDESSEGGAQ